MIIINSDEPVCQICLPSNGEYAIFCHDYSTQDIAPSVDTDGFLYPYGDLIITTPGCTYTFEGVFGCKELSVRLLDYIRLHCHDNVIAICLSSFSMSCAGFEFKMLGEFKVQVHGNG